MLDRVESGGDQKLFRDEERPRLCWPRRDEHAPHMGGNFDITARRRDHERDDLRRARLKGGGESAE